MPHDKIIPAPFTKGVNFTNWLEYRSAEEIDENGFGKQDFLDVLALGCDVVRLPIHFEKICKEEDGYLIPEKILRILDNCAKWSDEAGLYLIFDFHNATHAGSFTSVDVEKILNPVWTQIAARYQNKFPKLIFEIMNEPHGIEVPVWNEIIYRVFKLIRSIDKTHYLVAGGADWNSTAAMKTLPDFEDDKVIYTFHFYDPHTFTHQGAPWCNMQRVVGIPFPYDPDKMPPLPENPTETELNCWNNYPKTGTLEAVMSYFDQYAQFSRERNAPVYCGEFGCNAVFVDKELRNKWYKIVTDLLAERGIARTSWDYHGSFGIFDMDWKTIQNSHNYEKPKFPEDLNRGLLKAMGLNDQV